jgi:MFS family permease
MANLAPKESLTAEEVSQGLSVVIRDGLATQAMVTLTSGIFLVAFALQLGASNTVIGLLAAIPPLTELIQMPAISIVEKVRNRRLICITASSLARVSWIGIAFIPFFFGPVTGVAALVAYLVSYGCFSAISHCSWSSWIRDLVPEEILGTFFSRRMALAMSLGIALSLASGLLIDLWQTYLPYPVIYAYSLIFLGGFVAGAFDIFFMTRIPERQILPTPHISLYHHIREALADDNFSRLIAFMASWNFAVNLAAPFFTVYLLVMLDYDLVIVIILAVLSQSVSVLSYHMWGSIADRYSNKSVLRVAGPLFMICIFGWTFTTLPGKHLLTFPLLVILHILMGLSTSGVTLAAANIGLKLAPRGGATAYLASINIANSLAAGIAPIIGGAFVDYFAAAELSLILNWKSPGTQFSFITFDLQYWDFFFLFAFIIGIYSLHRLVLVRETGEVEEKVVVRDLITQASRDMRNLSTAGGLRFMLRFPLPGRFRHSGNGNHPPVSRTGGEGTRRSG